MSLYHLLWLIALLPFFSADVFDNFGFSSAGSVKRPPPPDDTIGPTPDKRWQRMLSRHPDLSRDQIRLAARATSGLYRCHRKARRRQLGRWL